jgi:antitoxin ParD1/3/4
MSRYTSILLEEYFEAFIANAVSSGRYNSASEVARTPLGPIETEETKRKQLNKALANGEKSNFIKNFNPQSYLKALHKSNKGTLEASNGKRQHTGIGQKA